MTSFDLHVLSTPPAFILSQDQTLDKKLIDNRRTVGGWRTNEACEAGRTLDDVTNIECGAAQQR